MPVVLAYLAGVLDNDYTINLIDGFGENPFQVSVENGLILQGLKFEEIVERIERSTQSVIIYLSSIASSYAVRKIISSVKERFPAVPVIIIENSQGVIGCSVEYIHRELIDSGADYLVIGENEERVPELLRALLDNKKSSIKHIDGLIYSSGNGVEIQPKASYIEKLDALPFPLWSLFPLKNYWELGYSHGPVERKFLALLTSRGCPFQCNFCVVPSMNGRKWRSRSPEDVVSEIKHLMESYGVFEFHWEDLNPTANEKRIVEICSLIMDNRLKITWKLVSGSKIETMSKDTLKLMKNAGCTYISYSPESGSKRVLKLMNKPFNHTYAMEMQKMMTKIGITSQACFVLGYPGEKQEDLAETSKYMKKLAIAGVDEVAFFIMTPIPGTNTFGEIKGFTDYSQLTFSPSWRDDFPMLNSFRKMMYLKFVVVRLMYHPLKMLGHLFNLLFLKFKTKTEMNVYRIYKLKFLAKKV